MRTSILNFNINKRTEAGKAIANLLGACTHEEMMDIIRTDDKRIITTLQGYSILEIEIAAQQILSV
jgi:hypothetical protein